ncbi:Uncharacterised protein [uncultured archaeon]|nr:Uncharacterised protein [uncultured archaeon]
MNAQMKQQMKKMTLTAAAVTGLASTAWATKPPQAEQLIKPVSAPAKTATEELLMLAAILGVNGMGVFGLYRAFTAKSDPTI